MRVLSVGEVLWDVFPQRELLGGAPLNFSAHLARLGHTVSLISGVGQDLRGSRAKEAIESLGVGSDFINVVPDRPTGVASVHTGSSGEHSFDIPRPAAFDELGSSPDLLTRSLEMAPGWLYFGTLAQTDARVEMLTRKLVNTLPLSGSLYDLNLRDGHWNMPLVHRLCGLASMLKMNAEEAKVLGASVGINEGTLWLSRFCNFWAAQFNLTLICVTMGPAGCMIFYDGECHWAPAAKVEVSDTVGAGDAFAAGFLHGFEAGWSLSRVARFANALGGLVASRPGGTPMWDRGEVEEVVARFGTGATEETGSSGCSAGI